MINEPPPLKGLIIGIPILIPIKGRGAITQRSGLNLDPLCNEVHRGIYVSIGFGGSGHGLKPSRKQTLNLIWPFLQGVRLWECMPEPRALPMYFLKRHFWAFMGLRRFCRKNSRKKKKKGRGVCIGAEGLGIRPKP